MLGSCCHGMPWHQSDDTRLDGHRWACHQCHNVGPMTVLRATTHERWRNMLGKANNKPSPIFRLTRKFCIYAYITFYHHQVVQGKKSSYSSWGWPWIQMKMTVFDGEKNHTTLRICFQHQRNDPTKPAKTTLRWARYAGLVMLPSSSMVQCILFILWSLHISTGISGSKNGGTVPFSRKAQEFNGNFRIQKWSYVSTI